MKTRFIFFFLLALALAGAPSPARAGLLEFFFPMLKKQEADPAQTLQAPFVPGKNDGKTPAGPQVARPLPENAIPMNLPHRATRQVSEWVITAVSEAMTFDKEDIAASRAQSRKYFTTAGHDQYDKFIQNSGLAATLDAKQYYVRSYVRDLPILLNEGAVSGYYRWLYEIPVTVSYMKRGEKDYRKSSPINQQMTITLQVGRSPKAEDAAGIVVESWKGEVQEMDKKEAGK